jgi:hypothetical protein
MVGPRLAITSVRQRRRVPAAPARAKDDLGLGLIAGHFAHIHIIPRTGRASHTSHKPGGNTDSAGHSANGKGPRRADKAAIRFGVPAHDGEMVITALQRQLGGPIEEIGLHRLALCERIAGEADQDTVRLNGGFLKAVGGAVGALIGGRRRAGGQAGTATSRMVRIRSTAQLPCGGGPPTTHYG